MYVLTEHLVVSEMLALVQRDQQVQQAASRRERQADAEDRYHMEQAAAEEKKRIASIFRKAARNGLQNFQEAKALQKVSSYDASLPMLKSQPPRMGAQRPCKGNRQMSQYLRLGMAFMRLQMVLLSEQLDLEQLD